jgi:hypothetical protein
MSAFPDVMHLLANELAGLTARHLSFTPRSPGSLDSCFFWHELPPVIGIASRIQCLWFRLVPFKELNRPLMLFSRLEIVKGSEVLTLSCLAILLA